MTAEHQPRPALEVVTSTDDTGDSDDWRAQLVIGQWQPEHQFIGCLMWLTADAARPLLDLVPETAIWLPTTRWAYELIRRLVDAGDRPVPPAVLAAGRRHCAAGALNPEDPPTEAQYRRLALYLFDAYSQVITPATAGAHARDVLDAAYRRAFDACGIRMQQLASCGADRDDLSTQFTLIRDELADLRSRAEAAAKPESSQS
jgi:hypothetical protein